MRAAAKTPTAGTTAAILTLLLCAAATSPASAQGPTPPGPVDASQGQPVDVGQVQLADVFAGQTIQVESGDPVIAQATAAGNQASTIGQDTGVNYNGAQSTSGNVGAGAQAFVSGSAGQLLEAESSAVGNTSTAGTCCGALGGLATQTLGPGGSVSAQSEATAGSAEQVSADATAIGNTHGWLAANGYVGTQTVQNASAPIDAETTATVGEVSGASGYSATSVANDVTGSGSGTGSLMALITRQTTTDAASSNATLTVQQDGGDTIQGQATATGNNLTLEAADGTAALDAQQSATADVNANAAAGIGGWSSASVGAYGVGNSILVDGQGPQATVTTSQANTGAITASSSFNGGAGGEAYVNATAIGNSMQLNACGSCGAGVGATVRQSNAGSVTAAGVYNGPAGGSVTGTASAIGNSIAIQVKSSG